MSGYPVFYFKNSIDYSQLNRDDGTSMAVSSLLAWLSFIWINSCHSPDAVYKYTLSLKPLPKPPMTKKVVS